MLGCNGGKAKDHPFFDDSTDSGSGATGTNAVMDAFALSPSPSPKPDPPSNPPSPSPKAASESPKPKPPPPSPPKPSPSPSGGNGRNGGGRVNWTQQAGGTVRDAYRSDAGSMSDASGDGALRVYVFLAPALHFRCCGVRRLRQDTRASPVALPRYVNTYLLRV